MSKAVHNLLFIPFIFVLSESIKLHYLFFVIYFTALESYFLFRNSIYYQKIFKNKNRFFIESDLDNNQEKKNSIYGFLYVVMGILLFFINNWIFIEEKLLHFLVLILITSGYFKLIKVFITSGTVYELLITNYKIVVYKKGVIVAEFYDLKNFELDQNKLILVSTNSTFKFRKINLNEANLNVLNSRLEKFLEISDSVRNNSLKRREHFINFYKLAKKS